MTKETLETMNKFIITTTGQDDKSQEIFESLESISDEEIMKAGEEYEQIREKSEKNKDLEQVETSEESKSVENNKFKNIGTIAGMSVEYDESTRTVKFGGDTFDLNPFEGKMSFMSKVSQYADLFNDEDVKKVMFTLNI